MDDTVETAEGAVEEGVPVEDVKAALLLRRRGSIAYADLAESESEDEFYDAIDAGVIEVEELIVSEKLIEKPPVNDEVADLRAAKHARIMSSSKGYDDPPRQRLKMENDDRPKISLWVSRRHNGICVFISKTHHVGSLGYSQIHDWQGHDKDDAAGFFQ
jgi:hypothetical protein